MRSLRRKTQDSGEPESTDLNKTRETRLLQDEISDDPTPRNSRSGNVIVFRPETDKASAALAWLQSESML